MKKISKVTPVLLSSAMLFNYSATIGVNAIEENIEQSNFLTESLHLNNLQKETVVPPADESIPEDFIVNDHGYSADLNKCLSFVEYYFGKYKDELDESHLRKALHYFGELPLYMTQDEDQLIIDKAKVIFNNLFLSLRNSIYEMKSESAGTMVVELSKEILFGWRKNKEISNYGKYYLEEGIVKFNGDEYNLKRIPEIQKDLDVLLTSYHYMVNTGEANTNSEELPDLNSSGNGNNTPKPPPVKPIPPIDNGEPPKKDDSNKGENPVKNESKGWAETYYKKEGDSCMIIKDEYLNGKLVSSSKNLVPKQDYVNCGIYTYIFDGIKNDGSVGIQIDRDYIDSNQNKDSNNFIFYTVNKNKLNPYYYNTGIRASVENKITYNQFKDALYQLSVKAKGASVDSNEKSLTIIEGKPILLDSKKDEYTKEEVESILDTFKSVDFEIREEKEGKPTSVLELVINSKEFITVEVDGTSFETKSFLLDNGTVMANMNEIITYLGGKVSKENTQITISKGDIEIKTFVGGKKYNKNSTELNFDSPIKNIKNDLYIDFEGICTALNYNVKWEPDDKKFIISSKSS